MTKVEKLEYRLRAKFVYFESIKKGICGDLLLRDGKLEIWIGGDDAYVPINRLIEMLKEDNSDFYF